MNRFISRCLCCVFFSGAIVQAEAPPAVKEAGEVYLKSFHKEMVDEDLQVVDPERERYIACFNDLVTNKKYDETVKLNYRTREVLVQILSVQMSQVSRPVKTSPDILQDSRVLGNDTPGEASVLDKLFPGYTLSGEVFKALMLAQPTYSRKEINRQQSLIKETINNNDELEAPLKSALRQMRVHEPGVAKLFDKSDVIYSPEIQELLDLYGNRSLPRKIYDQITSAGLSAISWGAYGVFLAGGIATAINPFLRDRYCSCKFVCNTLYSVFALGVMSSVEALDFYLRQIAAKNEMNLYRLIRIRVDTLFHYLRQAMRLSSIEEIPDELKLVLSQEEEDSIAAFLENAGRLRSVDPKARINYVAEASELLWSSIQLKQTIARVLYQTGRIDMYLAIARRMRTSDEQLGQITFAWFSGHAPSIKARELWNPMLDGSRMVTNNIVLGGRDTCPMPDSFWSLVSKTCEPESETIPNHMVLSGGNASGKSTLMRAITVNAIFLSQIFGIATAQSFQTGLFHSVYSHMDKYDQTGEFSSYESELNHASQLLSDAGSMDSNENMLSCFDELFSNTDPDEGLYVTNRVLSGLASQLRMISLISSHQDIETGIAPYRDDFALMHMHVEKVNKTLVKTYQLRDGQAKQTNALYHLMEKFRLFPDIYSELQVLIESENDE